MELATFRGYPGPKSAAGDRLNQVFLGRGRIEDRFSLDSVYENWLSDRSNPWSYHNVLAYKLTFVVELVRG